MTPHATDIDGNVDGPVQSGTFSGPVQTVTVQLPPPEERPRNIGQYMDALWKLVLADQSDRYVRQQEADAFRGFVLARLERIDDTMHHLSRRTIFVLIATSIALTGLVGVVLYVATR
jgi:hypothetical protein